MAIGALSRRPCKSLSERFAAFGASPVSLAEEWFLFDELGCGLHESLYVGSAHSLTVSVFALLFPSLLSFESVGQDRASAVKHQTISMLWHCRTEELAQKSIALDLKNANFRF